MQRLFTNTRTRPWWVMLIVLLTVVVGTQWATAQGVITWEQGNVCVDRYQPGSVCTAADVRIASMSPTIDEVCLFAGDYATGLFTVELLTGAKDRYDIGLFVGLDGGSAQTGINCYHDVLQPAAVSGWDFLGGDGPFLDTDGDFCADTSQGSSIYYEFQERIEIMCVDTDGDGVVDPVSTCTSWDNQADLNCGDVTGAYPSTKSKCKCESMVADPPILLYQGYDWGDLPDNNYGTLQVSDGPRHAIQRVDRTATGYNDYKPETQGGVAAVWLGQLVDYGPTYGETNGQPTLSADGDDTNTVNDEDGVVANLPWTPGTPNGGTFAVTVNSSEGTCIGCRLGFWIDWNNDGDFDDVGESYVESVVYGANAITFDVPPTLASQYVYARFRLYDGNYSGDPMPTGLVTNGEVEDYRFNLTPTSVVLSGFAASPQRGSIRVTWQTAGGNLLGFNLYRAESLGGPRTRLNSDLIPAEIPEGLVEPRYDFTDLAVSAGVETFYWLQLVDVRGAVSEEGPVSAVGGYAVYLPLVFR